MILYRSLSIEYLDKIGRKLKKTIPFDSNARHILADLYNDSKIVVLNVEGTNPEYQD